jgi:glycerophosphoryl diester phosphodiesterase
MALIAGSMLSGCAAHTDCLVIAHRGASAYLPEHTLPAYALGYGMGADVLEPDVVLTRDNVPICSHDLTIHNEAVMAASHVDRRRADGKWYFIDFDLAELKALNAPLGRNAERAAGMSLATLDEMIGLVQRMNAGTGRRVGIVPEAKAPEFHRDAGRPVEAAIVETLARHGYTKRTDEAIIQCFDLDTLRRIRHELRCDLRLVYLIGDPVADQTLDDAASFADGIGPNRKLIVEDDGTPGKQPDLIEKAHARGLAVYPYTFGADEAMTRRFMQMNGVTGIFTNNPDVAVRARDAQP